MWENTCHILIWSPRLLFVRGGSIRFRLGRQVWPCLCNHNVTMPDDWIRLHRKDYRAKLQKHMWMYGYCTIKRWLLTMSSERLINALWNNILFSYVYFIIDKPIYSTVSLKSLCYLQLLLSEQHLRISQKGKNLEPSLVDYSWSSCTFYSHLSVL